MTLAHFELVDSIFAQREARARVERRLQQYSAIDRHFPIAMLRECHGRPPYGVHYMAWRLGVWEGEPQFEVLDELLAHAASLPGWDGEQSLLTSAEFGQFWGLVWQLQVARLLSECCSAVAWIGGNGPDLRATVDGHVVHVECYSHQKWLGPVGFLSDVLSRIDPAIRVEHDLWMPVRFPGDVAAFLDAALRPFLDRRELDEAKQRAATTWPVDLALPAGTENLRLSVWGEDMSKYTPSLDRCGAPERYLAAMLEEAAKAKAGKNRLAEFPNNVVAINSLNEDFQASLDRHVEMGLPLPQPEIPEDIHLVTFSTCGIDEPRARIRHGFAECAEHPGLRILGLATR
jgi:hypothetical protein